MENEIEPLDKELMLIGAIGSIDERLSTMEAQMTKIMEVVNLVEGAILAMQDHPMLKMFGKK
jgi:hypothetical protein